MPSDSNMHTFLQEVIQTPIFVAWAFLIYFAVSHESRRLAVSSAIASLSLVMSFALNYIVHVPEGHGGDDFSHDLEWTYYIVMDALFAAWLACRRAPHMAVWLLLGASAYQVVRIYIEPYSALEAFLYATYEPLFLAYLFLLVVSLRPGSNTASRS